MDDAIKKLEGVFAVAVKMIDLVKVADDAGIREVITFSKVFDEESTLLDEHVFIFFDPASRACVGAISQVFPMPDNAAEFSDDEVMEFIEKYPKPRGTVVFAYYDVVELMAEFIRVWNEEKSSVMDAVVNQSLGISLKHTAE